MIVGTEESDSEVSCNVRERHRTPESEEGAADTEPGAAGGGRASAVASTRSSQTRRTAGRPAAHQCVEERRWQRRRRVQEALSGLRDTLGVPPQTPMMEVLLAAQRKLAEQERYTESMHGSYAPPTSALSDVHMGGGSASPSESEPGPRVPPASALCNFDMQYLTPPLPYEELRMLTTAQERRQYAMRVLLERADSLGNGERLLQLGVLLSKVLETSPSSPMPMALMITGFDSIVYEVFGDTRAVYNLDRDAMVGMSGWQHMHRNDALRVMAEVEAWKAAALQTDLGRDYVSVHHDRWYCGGCDPTKDDPGTDGPRFHWLTSLVFSLGGSLLGVLHIAMREADPSLSNSASTYIVCDRDGRIVHVDSGMHMRRMILAHLDVMPLSRREEDKDLLLFSLRRGQNFFDIIHASDRARCRECIEHVLAAGPISLAGSSNNNNNIAGPPLSSSGPETVEHRVADAAGQGSGDASTEADAFASDPRTDSTNSEGWMCYWRYNVHERAYVWNTAFVAALPDRAGFAIYEELASTRLHKYRSQVQ
ncbi:hypothetical protein CDCA_CDCA01G0155 [Cyanidium caldarium]|uniref:Uncharacterized protein n=1 Tax=Cyanidium caldarium TaxID=2771 RepID=A0AAV9IPV5_CYACA|nr:hypothetical protein CDCA_CDCA01G0155 [Cyanidium caldarium]